MRHHLDELCMLKLGCLGRGFYRNEQSKSTFSSCKQKKVVFVTMIIPEFSLKNQNSEKMAQQVKVFAAQAWEPDLIPRAV